MHSAPRIAILDSHPRSLNLALRLGLPCAGDRQYGSFDLLLEWGDENRLQLRDLRRPRARPVFVNVAELRPLPKRGPLAQAVGRKTRTVVDATAGLGGDTLRLAAMGYRVTALERNPVVAALLENGLERLGPRLNPRVVPPPLLINGDARRYLESLGESSDCVLLDPMFPPKRRDSALAAKELRLLRELSGDDEDATALFEAARKSGARRLVVKRPHYAPPLAAEPSHQFAGKLVRYDVYLRNLIGK
jgi:16S rRNA (guanine1516-N2)-methyltransferase